jgi:hypothetical protein
MTNADPGDERGAKWSLGERLVTNRADPARFVTVWSLEGPPPRPAVLLGSPPFDLPAHPRDAGPRPRRTRGYDGRGYDNPGAAGSTAGAP